MLNQLLFKEQILALQQRMSAGLRGELDQKVEVCVINELSAIYVKMVEKFNQDVKSGSAFPAQQRVSKYPEEERVFYALKDLLERMELDFTQKLVKDFTHGLEKETAIRKIKISFLDGVRRALDMARQV